MVTKKDFENVASEMANAGWRTIAQMPQMTVGQAHEAVAAHFRMVVIVGLAFRRSNERFNARTWISASVPESWRDDSYFMNRAIEAIESKSLRIWDESVTAIGERREAEDRRPLLAKITDPYNR
jgi:hypothetical protein